MKTKKKPLCCAIIAAAGESSRMGMEDSKQFLPLAGEPVLLRTLRAFENALLIDEIIVVCREEDLMRVRSFSCEIKKMRAVVPGGKTRQQSVLNGLGAIPGPAAYIAIQDGARPLVKPEMIDQVIREAVLYGAAAPSLPLTDTIKTCGKNGFVCKTLDRNYLRAMQTPQVFRRELYLQAMDFAEKNGDDWTDDCQLLEQAGFPVYLCEGDPENLKITTETDRLFAEALLWKRGVGQMRIGHGYDVHRLQEGRKLILGGVEIPWEKGLAGHSNADVLAHAIMDALLGAAAQEDIGKWFPEQDEKYAGADSMNLLSQVRDLLEKKGYSIVNIDATLLAQRPKLAPYVKAMRKEIAKMCGIDPKQVNVKATTEEGLGFTGAEEGIAAHAVCLLDKI